MASRDAASDEHLATDVLTELSWDPRVQPHEIRVNVKDGVVTLGGWVDAYAKRRAATAAAHRIRAVKAVANDIEVRLAAPGTPTDAVLTEVILSALEWNGLIPTQACRSGTLPAIWADVGPFFAQFAAPRCWEWHLSHWCKVRRSARPFAYRFKTWVGGLND
jgi:hypothetical protein